MLEDVCEIFQLHSVSSDLLIDLVSDLVSQGKMKEVLLASKASLHSRTMSMIFLYIFIGQCHLI